MDYCDNTVTDHLDVVNNELDEIPFLECILNEFLFSAASRMSYIGE